MANGDIVTPEDVAAVFEYGADGAMIGRGAIGNPWIFEQARQYLETGEVTSGVSYEERVSLCIRHLEEHAAYHGKRGIFSFRKFYTHYLKGMPDSTKVRVSLMEFEEVAPIAERLRAYIEHLRDREPAAVAG
jgi:tRNA-dihydrouridine synthase